MQVVLIDLVRINGRRENADLDLDIKEVKVIDRSIEQQIYTTKPWYNKQHSFNINHIHETRAI